MTGIGYKTFCVSLHFVIFWGGGGVGGVAQYTISVLACNIPVYILYFVS